MLKIKRKSFIQSPIALFGGVAFLIGFTGTVVALRVVPHTGSRDNITVAKPPVTTASEQSVKPTVNTDPAPTDNADIPQTTPVYSGYAYTPKAASTNTAPISTTVPTTNTPVSTPAEDTAPTTDPAPTPEPEPTPASAPDPVTDPGTN